MNFIPEINFGTSDNFGGEMGLNFKFHISILKITSKVTISINLPISFTIVYSILENKD